MFPVFKIFENLFRVPSGPKCPECQSLLVNADCPNMDCPQKVADWIIRWCSPDGMNIPAIDESTAKRLAKLHWVIHPGELYELSPSDWLQVDGLSEQGRDDIMQQLEESKNASPSSLLYGFRITGVDSRLAKRLVEAFENCSMLREVKPDKLTSVEGVDARVATAVRQWFKDSFNKKMLKMLERNGFRFN